jgi:hypothetical protein
MLDTPNIPKDLLNLLKAETGRNWKVTYDRHDDSTRNFPNQLSGDLRVTCNNLRQQGDRYDVTFRYWVSWSKDAQQLISQHGTNHVWDHDHQNGPTLREDRLPPKAHLLQYSPTFGHPLLTFEVYAKGTTTKGNGIEREHKPGPHLLKEFFNGGLLKDVYVPDRDADTPLEAVQKVVKAIQSFRDDEPDDGEEDQPDQPLTPVEPQLVTAHSRGITK